MTKVVVKRTTNGRYFITTPDTKRVFNGDGWVARNTVDMNSILGDKNEVKALLPKAKEMITEHADPSVYVDPWRDRGFDIEVVDYPSTTGTELGKKFIIDTNGTEIVVTEPEDGKYYIEGNAQVFASFDEAMEEILNDSQKDRYVITESLRKLAGIPAPKNKKLNESFTGMAPMGVKKSGKSDLHTLREKLDRALSEDDKKVRAVDAPEHDGKEAFHGEYKDTDGKWAKVTNKNGDKISYTSRDNAIAGAESERKKLKLDESAADENGDTYKGKKVRAVPAKGKKGAFHAQFRRKEEDKWQTVKDKNGHETDYTSRSNAIAGAEAMLNRDLSKKLTESAEETMKFHGHTFKKSRLKSFDTDDAANEFMEKNAGWGALGERDGKVWVAEKDYLGEANDLTVKSKTPAMSIVGEHKDNMDIKSAIMYLSQYPDGALHHDIFERENFVFRTRNGEWKFFDSVKDTSEPWDWRKDISELEKSAGNSYDMRKGWWYEPIDWKNELTGDTGWFDDLLNENAPSNEYFTLVGQPAGGKFEIIFGDFDRDTVKDELQSMKADADKYYKVLKVLKTKDDQASIDAAVAKLNGAVNEAEGDDGSNAKYLLIRVSSTKKQDVLARHATIDWLKKLYPADDWKPNSVGGISSKSQSLVIKKLDWVKEAVEEDKAVIAAGTRRDGKKFRKKFTSRKTFEGWKTRDVTNEYMVESLNGLPLNEHDKSEFDTSKYHVERDRNGHYGITNKETGKVTYVQGIDMVEFREEILENDRFWKLSSERQDDLLAKFVPAKGDVEK